MALLYLYLLSVRRSIAVTGVIITLANSAIAELLVFAPIAL